PLRPATMQRIFAPLPSGLWSEAEVILNNNSPNPTTIRPTFYRDGVGASGTPVTLRPAEVRWVKLSELNVSTERVLTTSDAIELSSLGHMLELGAQVILTRPKHGSVDVPFSMATDYRSATQEAVWSAPEGSRSVVALGNASDTTTTVTVQRNDVPSSTLEL